MASFRVKHNLHIIASLSSIQHKNILLSHHSTSIKAISLQISLYLRRKNKPHPRHNQTNLPSLSKPHLNQFPDSSKSIASSRCPRFFGRAFFGRAFFGRAFFGRAFFGRTFFGRTFFGRAFFGRTSFGRASLGRASFGRASFGHDSYVYTCGQEVAWCLADVRRCTSQSDRAIFLQLLLH